MVHMELLMVEIMPAKNKAQLSRIQKQTQFKLPPLNKKQENITSGIMIVTTSVKSYSCRAYKFLTGFLTF